MGDAGEGLLSDELRAQLGGGDVLMLKKSGKKAKGGGGGNFGMSRPDGRARGNFVMPRDKKMSKSQRRKLAKVEEDKRKREERAAVVARLEAAKLVNDESLTLLAGSARLGHKLTAKEKLRRELKAERAGITLPSSSSTPVARPPCTTTRRTGAFSRMVAPAARAESARARVRAPMPPCTQPQAPAWPSISPIQWCMST